MQFNGFVIKTIKKLLIAYKNANGYLKNDSGCGMIFTW